jgi:hypothetical protein
MSGVTDLMHLHQCPLKDRPLSGSTPLAIAVRRRQQHRAARSAARCTGYAASAAATHLQKARCHDLIAVRSAPLRGHVATPDNRGWSLCVEERQATRPSECHAQGLGTCNQGGWDRGRQHPRSAARLRVTDDLPRRRAGDAREPDGPRRRPHHAQLLRPGLRQAAHGRGGATGDGALIGKFLASTTEESRGNPAPSLSRIWLNRPLDPPAFPSRALLPWRCSTN